MGMFDMLGPMGGGSGGASNQSDVERMQFIKNMLAQLQGAERRPPAEGGGSTFVPPPAAAPPATGYGAGSREMTPELIQSLDMPGSNPSQPTDPFTGIQGRLGELSPEQLDQLEQMLSMRMNMMARRGF